MQRLRGSCRVRIGCICLVIVSAYVLFDLLDIDGSNFKNPAELCALAAEQPGPPGEGKGCPTHAPPDPHAALRRLPFTLSAVSLVPRAASPGQYATCLVLRPGRSIGRKADRSAEPVEPARRLA